jgi:hypothetical protein
MLTKTLFAVLLTVALVTMACSVTFNTPRRDVKTGPTQTDPINVPAPTGHDSADVTLAFGAGKLNLAPGAAALVEGTATYNVADFKPILTTNGNNIRVESGDLKFKGIPSFGKDIKNEWDLKLGSLPMNLRVDAGAYQGDLELGGLSLQSLEVNDGASDVDLKFSQANLVDMSNLTYKTGASNVRLEGLANANAAKMTFTSGAGDYTLDFSGTLARDVTVRIESGVSSIKVIVPEGVSATVTFEGALTNIDANGAWQKSGKTYTNAGSGPTITIEVSMGAGNLELNN